MKNPQKIKKFASHVRKLREAADLSQRQLADIAGVSKKTIQRIENADSLMQFDILISIADALEMELKEFFDF